MIMIEVAVAAIRVTGTTSVLGELLNRMVWMKMINHSYTDAVLIVGRCWRKSNYCRFHDHTYNYNRRIGRTSMA